MILAHQQMNNAPIQRPWGNFTNIAAGDGWHLKIIEINPKSRLSLQSHTKRSETWVVVEGDIGTVVGGRETRHTPGGFIRVAAGAKHRLFSEHGGKLVEVSFGAFDENDITRHEDDYGRA